MPKATYLVEEVSEYLRIHPYTVRRLAREGKIPCFKVGGQWRFDIEEIIKYTKKGNKNMPIKVKEGSHE